MKTIFKELDPMAYEKHSEADITLENVRVHRIPIEKGWNLVTRCHKLDLSSYSYFIGQAYGSTTQYFKGQQTPQMP